MSLGSVSKRLRILLVTVACDGTDVGEAWSSFQWVSRLCKQHNVTVVTTQTTGQPSARSQLPTEARVVEWPAQLDQFGRFSSMLKPDYVPYYFRARRWIKWALARGERFDVAHQLSPLAMRYPSPAAGLGIPLIMGPIGGSLETPAAFVPEFGAVPWYTRLRTVDRWRLRHDPILRRTYAGAAWILGVAPYVADLLNGIKGPRFAVMSETGVMDLPDLPAERSPDGILRILFVGRLTRSKGARDAVRALGLLADLPRWHFDVLGEGEDRTQCEREAQELGIDSRVTFHGRVPRATVGDFYSKAHIFLFPSFREPSGNAVLEAMSYGLPLIVADRGGPSHAVTPDCGVRLTPETPKQYATAIAAALRDLLAQPRRMRQMGLAARERIRASFLWDRKIEQVSQWYEELTAGKESPGLPPLDPLHAA